ncbi:MAG: TIR domain-containing protein [Desulfobacterales bacterium]|nr:MAG: TIR domain-containing protein [Desulfobacterales bacterium]
MSNIFISYSSQDRESARRLAQGLEQEGWSVWWDRKIAVGKSYQRVIETELDAADCVIVIWSENSVASDWVVAEAAEGRERNLLVPVSIDDAKPPLIFRQIQTADLSTWDGSPSAPVFRQLVNDIHPLIAESKKDETSAQPSPASGTAAPSQPAPTSGKNFKWYALAAAVLIAIGLLIAWPYVQPMVNSGKQSTPSAQVIDFSADPPQIEEGGSARISWKTKNAQKITLSTEKDAAGESIAPAGSKTVRPRATTTFFLKAQGSEPEKTADVAQITVTVTPPAAIPDPQIVVFEADHKVLTRGDGSALHWETAHASRIELDGAPVHPRGDIEIRPDQTTTYRLSAINESGQSESRAITIMVEDLPRDEIAEIQELLSALGYDAGTADGLPGPKTRSAIEAFQNDNGWPVTGLPSRYLAEKLREAYGSVPAPQILVFRSDRQKIARGETLNLHWETANADRVSLNPLGNVEASGERLVRPADTMAYELVATNRIGRTVRETIAIQVEVPLEIESLTVDRQRIDPDSKTAIHWRTSGAERVDLIPFGEVGPTGSKIVSPNKTTTYELVATSAVGAKVNRSITIEVGCPPNIDKFWADSDRIDRGSATYLRWNTSCAEGVEITSLGRVKPEGSLKVSPAETTTYILTAWGREKQSTQQKVTITVVSATVSGGTIILAGGGSYLDDKRVIYAILYGVPLEGISAKRIGKVQTLFEFPLGKNKIDAAKYNYDVKRSKKFMAEAGLVKGLRAYMVYTEDLSDLAQDVEYYLNRIGIQVKSEAASSATARQAAERNLKGGRPTLLLESLK